MTLGDIRATVAMFATVAAEGRWVGTEGGFDQDKRAAMYADSLADAAGHRFLVAVAGHRTVTTASWPEGAHLDHGPTPLPPPQVWAMSLTSAAPGAA